MIELSTYLSGPFDCMFLSYHVRILEWVHTLWFPKCQRTPCSKQALFLKFRWLQRDSNAQPLTLYMKTQPFGPTCRMIQLRCEYLSVWCIWLYSLINSHMTFRVNPHSIVSWMSRNFLLGAGAVSEIYLYRAFDFMFLSSHVHILEWIDTLSLPECQRNLCLTQPQYLKFKLLQRDSKLQPLSS